MQKDFAIVMAESFLFNESENREYEWEFFKQFNPLANMFNIETVYSGLLTNADKHIFFCVYLECLNDCKIVN